MVLLMEIHNLDCCDSVHLVNVAQTWRPLFGAANTMTTSFQNLSTGMEMMEWMMTLLRQDWTDSLQANFQRVDSGMERCV